MFSPPPIRAALPRDDAELEAFLETLPPGAAVFLLTLDEGQQPYLGRCANLRRRVTRVLRRPEGVSRLLNLRGIARELTYWPAASSLEGSLVLLDQARSHFRDRYRRMVRLRFPSFVRLLTKNRFPRVTVSSQTADPAATFGPFLYRSQAEDFASRALDHFLLRRCDEDLAPAPDHPGCIYGEMNLCLRPCQAAVGNARYREEADAFLRFLESGGESLRKELELQRDTASQALDFEGAARAHKRLQKLDECWRGMSSFCGLLSELDGVAVTAGAQRGEMRLWPVFSARLQRAVPLALNRLDARSISDALSNNQSEALPVSEETAREALAVLTKWLGSSWCDGEWVKFDDRGKPPTRKIANAARRVHARRWGEGVAEDEGVAADETKVLPADDR